MGQTQSIDHELSGSHTNSNGNSRRNTRRSRSLDPDRSSNIRNADNQSLQSKIVDSHDRNPGSESPSFSDQADNKQYKNYRNDDGLLLQKDHGENLKGASISQPSVPGIPAQANFDTVEGWMTSDTINDIGFTETGKDSNFQKPLQKLPSVSPRILVGLPKTTIDNEIESTSCNSTFATSERMQHQSYGDNADGGSIRVASQIYSGNGPEFDSEPILTQDNRTDQSPNVSQTGIADSEDCDYNQIQRGSGWRKYDDAEDEILKTYRITPVGPDDILYLSNIDMRADSKISKRTRVIQLADGAIGYSKHNVDEATDYKVILSSFEETPQECEVNFYPVVSRDFEWMGRSIECLVLGHLARAPILQLDESTGGNYIDMSGMVESFSRRRSTASTFSCRRRSTASTFNGRRPSSFGVTSMQGGTLANYYSSGSKQLRNARTSNEASTTGFGMSEINSRVPMGRRRSSLASCLPQSTNENDSPRRIKGGPNVVLNIIAREITGKTCFPRCIPEAQRLRIMGGDRLFNMIDKPSAGMVSEVGFLAASIDLGDLGETHMIVTRICARLTGDSTSTHDSHRPAIDDPTMPPTAPRFYAGGGRIGLERESFVLAGGVQVFIRIFREKSFVGQEMSLSYDARDLSPELVSTRLAPCWNEILGALRELVYFVPSVVEDGKIADEGDFLPFLFTLLAHDSCFDGAVALIEEILSLMVQTQHNPSVGDEDSVVSGGLWVPIFPQPMGRTACPSMFFLGNITNLYKLWRSFNCRQLAHFCRILALLVFEPEDRQLLESPAVLKSLELLERRRNRAARAGRDSSVDMNQSILLGDKILIRRLLKLVAIMNFAPPLRRFSPYHVMAQFPVVADTLVMLGLNELENWDEAERQERLARTLLSNKSDETAGEADGDEQEPMLCDLGAVADMLEGLSTTLAGSNRQSQNQISHIIHVISAAQQAGVIVGRNQNRRRRSQAGSSVFGSSNRDRLGHLNGGVDSIGVVDSNLNGNAVQGLASVAGILTDQILFRRLSPMTGPDLRSNYLEDGDAPRVDTDMNTRSLESRHLINTPEDAANSLQFNAMLLGPYQVEVLFVLCTLLGGRRKYDAQDLLNQLGVVSVLEGMFQRLPWYSQQSQGVQLTFPSTREQNVQQNGIHGENCNCTPESALCVQYLRMLHNFCDRDCDNYEGRKLLLSESEIDFIKFGSKHQQQKYKQGLLSKIISSFIRESDESPYRFWLASCIESYLRGSLPEEQMFVAKSGLLDHLVKEISSDRLHCAGSLQTSFDLLGELSKGNPEVVELLVDDLDEEKFRRLMGVASTNLVDSNVFIRSLLLSLERLSTRTSISALHVTGRKNGVSMRQWTTFNDVVSRRYLTHSWWDTKAMSLLSDIPPGDHIDTKDEARESDWFPPSELMQLVTPVCDGLPDFATNMKGAGGSFGWLFAPDDDTLSQRASIPNSVDRLCWFLASNQARLLRDLLVVVDLRNINHENICCLNTAVVIAVFAHRRRQLSVLLQELKVMNDEEKESKRRAIEAARRHEKVVDTALMQAMSYLGIETQPDTASNGRILGGSEQIGDRSDFLRNFREVLWFWIEYYSHRGRDRLSLEFSSHIRFHEWYQVVTTLTADDGSPTSLVRSPVRLPLSPYHKAARVTDSPARGE